MPVSLRQIVVLSGKGGTGKTSVVGSFAVLSKNSVMIDCDVDAPNLHIIIDHKVIERGSFSGSRIPVIDPMRCNECRYCVRFCKFKAIIAPPDNKRNVRITIRSDLCEGCGICAKVCPKEAIKLENKINGEWYVSKSRFRTLVYALLEPGSQNSGKLVALLKQKGEQIAFENQVNIILVDGPPGIGCPVLASMANAHMILLVAEPTKSGLSDFMRIAELSHRFSSQKALIVNRYDLNHEMTQEIEKISGEMGIPVIGKIPFDTAVIDQMIKGKTLAENPRSEAGKAVKDIWNYIQECL